jgi:hypothetical protein
MTNLRDIAWCADATEAHAKAQNEPATQEHPSVDRWGLNTRANYDNNRTCEHTDPAAKVVVHWPAEKDGRYRADVIDCKCDAGATAGRSPIQVSIEGYSVFVRGPHM